MTNGMLLIHRLILPKETGIAIVFLVNGMIPWYGMYTPRDLEFIVFGRAGNFKIELNRTMLVDESTTFWKSVLTHELGHAVCLGDNPSSGNQSIMNYDRDRNYLTWPTSDDVAGVNDAYS